MTTHQLDNLALLAAFALPLAIAWWIERGGKR